MLGLLCNLVDGHWGCACLSGVEVIKRSLERNVRHAINLKVATRGHAVECSSHCQFVMNCGRGSTCSHAHGHEGQGMRSLQGSVRTQVRAHPSNTSPCVLLLSGYNSFKTPPPAPLMTHHKYNIANEDG